MPRHIIWIYHIFRLFSLGNLNNFIDQSLFDRLFKRFPNNKVWYIQVQFGWISSFQKYILERHIKRLQGKWDYDGIGMRSEGFTVRQLETGFKSSLFCLQIDFWQKFMGFLKIYLAKNIPNFISSTVMSSKILFDLHMINSNSRQIKPKQNTKWTNDDISYVTY